MMDAGRHPKIEILTCSEVIALEGGAGAFHATVRRDPTGVDASRCTGCGDCAEVCPVTAPNPFDLGLGTRKAIFRPFAQAVPAIYAIDPQLCLNDDVLIACELCRNACTADAIDLERKPTELALDVGAVIVATGFDEFDPRNLRRYAYSIAQNVITSLELERLLNASGPTLGHVIRPSDRKPPRKLVYVQCVGARGEAGRPYCSRFCCMNAIKDAMLLKQHDPDIESVTILYTDIRAFGKGFEEFYERARSMDWINFVRGRPAKIMEIDESHDLEVYVEDTESGHPMRLAADMVVLSCAGIPSEGTSELAMHLGLRTSPMGFIATKSGSSPVVTTREGIFVCGSAAGPQVIPDCVAQGSAAAAEAAIVLRRALGAEISPQETETAPNGISGKTDSHEIRAKMGAGALHHPQSAPEPLADIRTAFQEGETAQVAEESPDAWPADMPEVAEAYAAGSWATMLGESAAMMSCTGVIQTRAAAVEGTGPKATASGLLRAAAGRQEDHGHGVPGSREALEQTPLAGAPSGDYLAASEPIPLDGEPRIGIFLCHCGINIAGVLDMEQLLAHAQDLPGVVHASEELFACSSSSQMAIQEAIAEHRLNRVVVAACTPRTHEPIFRENCLAAGLNPYLFEMVNIRDQCSWVHAAEPAEATRKAMDLLRMATARARRLEPLEPTEVGVTQHVLVVGAGLAGMKAASDLCSLGFNVTLVEHSSQRGGMLSNLHALYPDGRSAEEAIEEIFDRLHTSGVEFRPDTELRAVSGYVGNFRVTLGPTNGGQDKPDELEIGAILIAIGAEAYQPSKGEFGFQRFGNVITSLELEARLAQSDPAFEDVRTVAFIQCVGSRRPGAPEEGNRGYPGCSRICCPTTVKQALELDERGISSVVFYRDMRMVGCGAEEMYREVRGRGTVFIRVHDGSAPEVTGEGKGEGEGDRATAVTAYDTLLRRVVSVPVDLVVLGVGLVPRSAEAGRIQEMLKIPKGPDGFFLERHPELGPVETCVNGVILCGAAQGPKDLPDSLAQASAAAAKAASLLGKGRLLLDPAVSTVNGDLCRGCGLCVSICEFNAPTLVESEHGRIVAEINSALCTGCGTCAVWCPTGAIKALHFSDDQITAMIDSLFLTETR